MKKRKIIESKESLSVFKRLRQEVTGKMNFIEIHGDCELILSGCLGIIDYDSENVQADTLSGMLTVTGKNLCLDVFRGDILTVTGKIINVNLSGTGVAG